MVDVVREENTTRIDWGTSTIATYVKEQGLTKPIIDFPNSWGISLEFFLYIMLVAMLYTCVEVLTQFLFSSYLYSMYISIKKEKEELKVLLLKGSKFSSFCQQSQQLAMAIY